MGAAATFLPARFPEHGFEFMEPAAAERLGIPKARDMIFNVLSKRLETEDRSEVLAEGGIARGAPADQQVC